MKFKTNNLSLILLIIFTFFIIYFSLKPINQIIFEDIANADKTFHLITYMIWAFLLSEVLKKNEKKFFLTFLISSIFGIIIEITQGLTYQILGRFFSFYDILFNELGIILTMIWLKKERLVNIISK